VSTNAHAAAGIQRNAAPSRLNFKPQANRTRIFSKLSHRELVVAINFPGGCSETQGVYRPSVLPSNL